MQLAQEGQTRRTLPFEQHQNDWKVSGLDSLVECFVVFKYLPIADTSLAYQQDEGVRLRDFLRERS